VASGERARLSVLVSGLVQGVGFRWHTQRVAEGLRLAGWVRNLRDGSVEIQAEGERATLEHFLEWCRHGPDFAQVDTVSVAWGPAQDEDVGFVVRH
jgi:acylphosphatase